MTAGNNEDLRASTNVHIGISTQLFSASLVLMGFLLGYVDVKGISMNSFMGILCMVVFILLFTSLILAAIGIKRIRNKGDWGLNGVHIFFRLQTVFNFIAIFLFVIVFFAPSKKSDEIIIQEKILKLKKRELYYDSLLLKQSELTNRILQEGSIKLDSACSNKKTLESKFTLNTKTKK